MLLFPAYLNHLTERDNVRGLLVGLTLKVDDSSLLDIVDEEAFHELGQIEELVSLSFHEVGFQVSRIRTSRN